MSESLKLVEGRRAKTDTSASVEPPRPVVLDRYRIPSGGSPDSSVEVTITDIDSVGRYGVASPPLDKEEQAALEVLRRDFLDVVPPEASGTPEDTVKEYLWPTAERAGVFQPGRAYHIEVQAGQAVSSAGAVAVSA